MTFSPSTLLSFGLSVIFAGFLQSQVKFWDDTYPIVFGAFRYSLLFGLIFIGAAFYKNRFRVKGLSFNLEGSALSLLFIFFSNWLCRSHSFVWGPLIRGEIILCAALSYILLSKKIFSSIFFAALFSAALLATSFFAEASGRLLFTDDNGPVLYRLMLLKENFPFIPFYSPDWNGGFDARDFFATGILNVFLPFSPLIYLFEVRDVYNIIVATIIFAITPLCAFWAAKLEEMPKPAPSLAAILSLTSSLLWYRWALKYGAMGFVMSVALAPLCVALVNKLISPTRELSKKESLLSILIVSLALCWPLIGVALIPLGIIGVVYLRSLFQKKYGPITLAFILLIAIPWMGVFVSVSNVGTFLTLSRPVIENREQGLSAESIGAGDVKVSEINQRAVRGGVRKLSLENGGKNLRDFAVGANPLLLLFAIPCLLALPRKESRFIYGSLFLWLLFLGAFIKSVKPQLELERMFVFLSIILSVPVGFGISVLIKDEKTKFAAALALGFLFAAVFSSSLIIRNRTFEQYAFDSTLLNDAALAIKEYGGEGRTVFSGFVLHQFGNGHIAPLARIAKKPLVASSPFHNVWWYTDVIPQSFRSKGEEGIEKYLDLMNATSVIAHEGKWRAYFEKRADKYKSVWKGGGFELFTRVAPQNGYFLEGKGAILTQTSNAVVLKVDSDTVLIKFNYFPFLASSSCKISGKEVHHSIKFIELTNCTPGSEVKIWGKGGFNRLGLKNVDDTKEEQDT